MANIYWVANTNLLQLVGLANRITGEAINDATVTVTIVDAQGEPISETGWPLEMVYQPQSDGDYRAELPADLNLSPGRSYRAEIHADGGAGLIGFWSVPIIAKVRTR